MRPFAGWGCGGAGPDAVAPSREITRPHRPRPGVAVSFQLPAENALLRRDGAARQRPRQVEDADLGVDIAGRSRSLAPPGPLSQTLTLNKMRPKIGPAGPQAYSAGLADPGAECAVALRAARTGRLRSRDAPEMNLEIPRRGARSSSRPPNRTRGVGAQLRRHGLESGQWTHRSHRRLNAFTWWWSVLRHGAGAVAGRGVACSGPPGGRRSRRSLRRPQ